MALWSTGLRRPKPGAPPPRTPRPRTASAGYRELAHDRGYREPQGGGAPLGPLGPPWGPQGPPGGRLAAPWDRLAAVWRDFYRIEAHMPVARPQKMPGAPSPPFFSAIFRIFAFFSKSVFCLFHYARQLRGACPVIFLKIHPVEKPTPEARQAGFCVFSEKKVPILSPAANVDRNLAGRGRRA